MTTHDTIASPTLAQLYIDQGHLTRARQVLDAVLHRDPFHGPALVLRARLETRSHASLSCRLESGELQIRWQKARIRDSIWLLVKIITFQPDGTLDEVVDAHPCNRPNGSRRIPLPSRPGSAVACLVHREYGHDTPLTVAQPVSW